MTATTIRELERRVLLVAPTKRDGEVSQSILTQAGLQCVACAGLRELTREIEIGAAVLLLTEEAFDAPGINELLATLAKQPPWSDLAIVLLLRGEFPTPVAAQVLGLLRNVTLLERPAPIRTLVSAIQTAVRGRERQYDLRDQIESIRRAEATSTELRRQLEIAIDASELGTFHCDIPLHHVQWNDRCKAHFWLPPQAEVNMDVFYSLLHPDDRERTRQAVENCVYGGQNYDIEYRTVSPLGLIRWVRATGRTYYDELGQPIQFDGTTQDVSQRKSAEETLKESDRRKDEFLATLAHELRNPLAPIRNSLHVLRLSGEISPELECVHDVMERQVNQMVRLIDDLLDVSRISRGKIELRKETVELATIVATAVETVKPILDAAGHQLAISVPPEPMILDADPIRLAQIIGNLLNNAAKYTPQGGQIWLTAYWQDNNAVISIRDTGVGIPANMKARIFEMFAQVDQSISRAQGGLGIGLALTKSFVEMHGGRIEAHSAGTNQGSEFIVYLPTVPNPQHPSCPAKPCQSNPPQLSRYRVLIVDDTRAAGYILGKLLETMGQQVRVVNNAAAALESARAERPDLIISDIGMPQMNGYELARHLRNDPILQRITLVALTGYGQEGDKQLAREAGFDRHLVKPTSVESLQELLSSLPTSTAQDETGFKDQHCSPR